jgi:hypothetical protein
MRAAVEWKEGMLIFYRMLPTIMASREVGSSSASGRRKPLKKAAGLNKAFLSAMYK